MGTHDLPGLCPGTVILTHLGSLPVETIRAGDRLQTADGSQVSVVSFAHRDAMPDDLPLLVRAQALGPGLPARDLFLSGNACVAVPVEAAHTDEVARVTELKNGHSIIAARSAEDSTAYIVLTLERAATIRVEGVSLAPDASPDIAEALSRHVLARAAAPFRLDSKTTGHLDMADRSHARGWARDTAAGPDGRATIRLLANGLSIAQIEAHDPRPDLHAAGIGDGQHGFHSPLPPGLPTDRPLMLQAVCAIGGHDLEGSPRYCPALHAIAAVPDFITPPADSAYQGHLDGAALGRIHGWARNPGAADAACAVLIYENGRLLGRAIANGFRADLAQAGLGHGRHGFAFDLGLPLSPLTRHIIEARIEADGTPLAGSPQIIEPANSLDDTLMTALDRAIDAIETPDDGARALDWLQTRAEALKQRLADTEISRQDRDIARARQRAGIGVAIGVKPRALVVDECLPDPTRDAGSVVLLAHIRSLQRLGYDVGFAASTQMGAECPALEALGVTLHREPVYRCVEDVLRRHANALDCIYLHRAAQASSYLALARRAAPRARILYSVADLHHLRLERQAKAENRPELMGLANRMRVEEQAAALLAHATLTHSTVEAEWLGRAAPNAAITVATWDEPRQKRRGGKPGRGIGFLGSYAHAPNEDAAIWLLDAIMPAIWAVKPETPCILAGSGMTERVRRAAHNARGPVELMPDLAELTPFWRKIALSIAPLRFGAGVKGKVIASLAADTPCLMTPVAAEGVNWPEALATLIAEDAASLADLARHLLENPGLRTPLIAEGRALLDTAFSEHALDSALARALRVAPPLRNDQPA